MLIKTQSQQRPHFRHLKRMRTLIYFALREGWNVKINKRGQIKLTKSGCASIYTASLLQDDFQHEPMFEMHSSFFFLLMRQMHDKDKKHE